jgi:hypothetical protein
MPTSGQELGSLDFQAMIGGPLCAVVEAQAQSAISTINFIKTVGFKPSSANPSPTRRSINRRPNQCLLQLQKNGS